MGPVRRVSTRNRLRHLVIAPFALFPSPALADICATARPNWTPGADPTLLSEALALSLAPPSLILFLASVACLRFRLQWLSLLVVVLWTAWISLIVFLPPNDVQQQAIAQGCIGSPSLFIGLVAALSVAMILYTAPRAHHLD